MKWPFAWPRGWNLLDEMEYAEECAFIDGFYQAARVKLAARRRPDGRPTDPYGSTPAAISGAGEPIPVVSEILAWRGWNFAASPSEPILQSVTYPVRWDGPTLLADAVPTAKNGHGIHALKVKDTNSSYLSEVAAFGEVALSGIVVEGTDGYRAERATIRSLWVASPRCRGTTGERYCAWEIAGMLAARYEVEVDVAEPNAEAEQNYYLGAVWAAANNIYVGGTTIYQASQP